MALRLLGIDLPPLYVATSWPRRSTRRDAEGVFVDLPPTGGDIQALAFAAHADAVIAPLESRRWPAYCAQMVGPGNGMPLLGLDCDAGCGRISELRAVETCRTDCGVEGLTIDDFVDAAGRAASKGGHTPW